MRQELALLEAWVGELQLEHLGPDFTQRLAAECELWQLSRAEEGREAMEEFGKTQQAQPTHSRLGSTATPGETAKQFRVGLHQSKARWPDRGCLLL